MHITIIKPLTCRIASLRASSRSATTISVISSSRLVKFLFDLAKFDGTVTARKDDAPAATKAAITNVAGVMSFSEGGGLIQTTLGRRQQRVDRDHRLGFRWRACS